MDQKQIAPEKDPTTKLPVLYVAFELGNSTWKMACSDGRKVRHVTVAARDLDQVERALLRAQDHFAMAEGCATVSCYEAGRDGFWLHRYFCSLEPHPKGKKPIARAKTMRIVFLIGIIPPFSSMQEGWL